MSDTPAYTFSLQFDLADPEAATVTVIDQAFGSGEDDPPVLKLPTGGPPYFLEVGESTTSSAALAFSVVDTKGEPFDPARTTPCRVLTLEAWVQESRVETRDTARLAIKLTNTSRYYVAEDIRMQLTLTDAEGNLPSTAPDGRSQLELVPMDYWVRCVDPGGEEIVTFALLARNVAPGAYRVGLELDYRIMYWDGREASTRSEFEIPVVSDVTGSTSTPAARSTGTSAVRLKSQTTFVTSQEERSSMSPMIIKTPRQVPQQQRKHNLRPIEFEVPLPHGGKLSGTYALVKGKRTGGEAEQCYCVYGLHKDGEVVESYFSTQDDARFEITLTNYSPWNLRHVNLTDIRIFTVDAEGCPVNPVTETAPDGNYYFEVQPTDRYFGDIAAGATQTRDLVLITRCVAGGLYALEMKLDYDIERCNVPLTFPIEVNPD